MTTSPSILAAVESALPVAPSRALPPREIAIRIDCYALNTVRHALRELVIAGRAERCGPHSGNVFDYRKNPTEQPQ